VQSATLAALWTRHALAVPWKFMPIFEGKAAIVPRPELPSLVEPEEQPVMMVPVAEVMMLEPRRMAEPEHDVAVAELEHETALAEMSRFEMWDMSELECETAVAEVPEVPRLERSRLPKEATVVELESVVSQVQLRASLPREMAKTETAVTCLGWLRRHCQRRYDSCECHDLAHHSLPDPAQRHSSI
jgi:hypothetical protein